MTRKNNGFTLIELIIVVAIISVLFIVVLAGLKPAQRLSETRDARRSQDIGQILTGIHECVVDKKDGPTMGTCLGSATVGETYEVVSGAVVTGCKTMCSGATSESHCLRLDTTLSDYFTLLPKDPNISVVGHTGYSLTLYSNGMVVLDACKAENGTIKISR